MPAFIDQALSGTPLTVHGDGRQTRSLQYVDDLVEGVWRFLNSDLTGPMNLGNPEEISIRTLAELIRDAVGSSSDLEFVQRPQDDPEVRCPDIAFARAELGWEPQVSLSDGLSRTIEWARTSWAA